METSQRENQNQNHQNHIPSPNNSTTSSSNSNGLLHNHHNHNSSSNNPPPPQQQQPPTTPRPITRSEPNNPYPTTFVQADTTSFKQVVQMLTGSTTPTSKPDPPRNPIPPIKTGPRKDKSSKLYERRNSLKNFKISPLTPGFGSSVSGFSPRNKTQYSGEILSPSMLDFPSLVLSPVTPLIPDPFNRSPSNLNIEAEDKAISQKGFYLHPSPSSTPRDSEPRLLPLFPVTSPRVSSGSSTCS